MNLERQLPQSATRLKPLSKQLFWGIWIRWENLSLAEKVVCACITLIPVWWLCGWRNLFIPLVLCLAVHDFYRFGSIRLRHPSISVIAAFCFGVYSIICYYFYRSSQNLSISPNFILSPINSWICFSIILWYIQDRKIRIRQQVVAWSFSVVVFMMLVLWAVIYFGWHQADYEPPRSILGLFSGKALEYEPGLGNSNYLIPYFPTDTSLPGFVRYVYFFPGPEALALVLAFVSLLALDIKNRLWSLLLFFTSIFLLLTSGTRSVWVNLPVVLCIRYFLTAGQVFGPAFVCGLLSIISFGSLSFPPISNVVLRKFSKTAQDTANARADSTEVRGEIYRRTIAGIMNASDPVFLFGHVVTGEGVLPGYAPAVVGSHSFILGTLLYRSGVIGTVIFFIYWGALLWSFYKTRADRPLSVLILILFSLTFATMELELPVMLITLICIMMQKQRVSTAP